MMQALPVERIVVVVIDCLRWDFYEPYRTVYPDGYWYKGISNFTGTHGAMASIFTGRHARSHGVYESGTKPDTSGDLLSDTHSLSTSHHQDYRDFLTNTALTDDPTLFNTILNTPKGTYQFDFDEVMPEYDLILLHDSVVHRTSNYDQYESITADNTVAENRAIYADAVADSATVHRHFLDRMKAHDYHEDTLYVVVGDHGQAFGAEPYNELLHGGLPCPETCTVPFAFLSEQYDTTVIDTTTNARSIDVTPTLWSYMNESDHEHNEWGTAGVDLTARAWQLGAYSESRETKDNDRVQMLTLDGTHFVRKGEWYDTPSVAAADMCRQMRLHGDSYVLNREQSS